MPVSQIPHRVVRFSGSTLPTFPAQVEVTAELGPAELFGEETLSGKLHLSPVGRLGVTIDPTHGGVRKLSGGRLPKPRVDTVFFEVPLRIDGKNATITTQVLSETAFKRLVDLVANFLPSFISAALGAPVELTDLFGTVDKLYFEAVATGTYSHEVSNVPAERAIAAEMELLAAVPAEQAQRIFVALRYLNQERWLEYQAPHPTYFAGERLLNLSKALEALFGCSGDGAGEKLRECLRELGVSERLAEVAVATLYTRNQVDVGHVRLHALSSDELSTLHKLLANAALLLRWLVRRVMVTTGHNDSSLPPLRQSAAASGVLSRAAEVLQNLGPEERKTLLADAWEVDR